MGWNEGYTIFEATVMGAYDLGKLDKKLLSVLMEPYRDSDIDSGGEVGLVSKDGLSIQQVVLKTCVVKAPKKPDLPKNYRDWTPEQDKANEAYQEAMYEAFNKVTAEFGWR